MGGRLSHQCFHLNSSRNDFSEIFRHLPIGFTSGFFFITLDRDVCRIVGSTTHPLPGKKLARRQKPDLPLGFTTPSHSHVDYRSMSLGELLTPFPGHLDGLRYLFCENAIMDIVTGESSG